MTLVELDPDEARYTLSGLEPDTTYEVCVEYETTESSTSFYPIKICDEVKTSREEVAEEKKDNSMLYVIIGAAVGGGLILILLLVMICIICKRKRNKQASSQNSRRDEPDGHSTSGYLNGHLNNVYFDIERVDDLRKHKNKTDISRNNVDRGQNDNSTDQIQNARQNHISPPASPNSATRYRHPNVREIESVFMRSSLEHLDEIISEAESEDEIDDSQPKFKTIKRARANEIAAMIEYQS